MPNKANQQGQAGLAYPGQQAGGLNLIEEEKMKRYYRLYVENERTKSFTHLKKAMRAGERAFVSGPIGDYPKITVEGPVPGMMRLNLTPEGWK